MPSVTGVLVVTLHCTLICSATEDPAAMLAVVGLNARLKSADEGGVYDPDEPLPPPPQPQIARTVQRAETAA